MFVIDPEEHDIIRTAVGVSYKCIADYRCRRSESYEVIKSHESVQLKNYPGREMLTLEKTVGVLPDIVVLGHENERDLTERCKSNRFRFT